MKLPRSTPVFLLLLFAAACTMPEDTRDGQTMESLLIELDGDDRSAWIDDFPDDMPGVDWAKRELGRRVDGSRTATPRARGDLVEAVRAAPAAIVRPLAEQDAVDSEIRAAKARAEASADLDRARNARLAAQNRAESRARILEKAEANLLRLERLEKRIDAIAAKATGAEPDTRGAELAKLRTDLDDAVQRLSQIRSAERRLPPPERPSSGSQAGQDLVTRMEAQREALEAQQRALESMQRRLNGLTEGIEAERAARARSVREAAATKAANEAAVATRRRVEAFEKRFEASLATLAARLDANEQSRTEELTLLRRELGDAISGFVTASAKVDDRARDVLPGFARDLAAIRRRLAASEDRAGLVRNELAGNIAAMRKALETRASAAEKDASSAAKAVDTRLGARLDALAESLTKQDTRRRSELASIAALIESREATIEKEREASLRAVAAFEKRFQAALATLDGRMQAAAQERKQELQGLRKELGDAIAKAPAGAGAPKDGQPVVAGFSGELKAIRERLSTTSTRADESREKLSASVAELRRMLEARSAPVPKPIDEALAKRLEALVASLDEQEAALERELTTMRKQLADRETELAKREEARSKEFLARLDGLRDEVFEGFDRRQKQLEARLASDKRGDEIKKQIEALRRDFVARLEAQRIELAKRTAGAPGPSAIDTKSVTARIEALRDEVFAKLDARQKTLEARLAENARVEDLTQQLQGLREDFLTRLDAQRVALLAEAAKAEAARTAGFAERFAALEKTTSEVSASASKEIAAKLDGMLDDVLTKLEKRQTALEARVADDPRATLLSKQLESVAKDLEQRLSAQRDEIAKAAAAAEEKRAAEAARLLASIEKRAAASGGDASKSILTRLEGMRSDLLAKIDERQKALEARIAREPNAPDLAKQVEQVRTAMKAELAEQSDRIAKQVETLETKRSEEIASRFAAFETSSKKADAEAATSLTSMISSVREDLTKSLAERGKEVERLRKELAASDSKRAEEVTTRFEMLETRSNAEAEASKAVLGSLASLRGEMTKMADERDKLLAGMRKDLGSVGDDLRAQLAKREAADLAKTEASEKDERARFTKLQKDLETRLDEQRRAFDAMWKERAAAIEAERVRELAREDALSRRLADLEKTMQQRFTAQTQSFASKLEQVGDPGPAIVEEFAKMQARGAEYAKTLEAVQKELAELGRASKSRALQDLDRRLATLQSDLGTRFETQRVDFARRLADAVKPNDEMKERVDTLIGQSLALTKRIEGMSARLAEMRVGAATGAGGTAGAEAVRKALEPLTSDIRDDVRKKLAEQRGAFEKALEAQQTALVEQFERERKSLVDAVKSSAGAGASPALETQLRAIDARFAAERKAFADMLDKSQTRVSQAIEDRLSELAGSAKSGGAVPGIVREIDELRSQLEKAEVARARNRKDMILRLDALGSSLGSLRTRLATSGAPAFVADDRGAARNAAARNTAASKDGASRDGAGTREPAEKRGSDAETGADGGSKTRFASNEGKDDRSPRGVTRLEGDVGRARRVGSGPADPNARPGTMPRDEAPTNFWRKITSSQWLPWGLGIAALLALLMLLFRSEKEAEPPVAKRRPAAGERRAPTPTGAGTRGGRAYDAPRADSPHVPKTEEASASDAAIPKELLEETVAALMSELPDDPKLFEGPSSKTSEPSQPLSVSSLAGGIAGGPRVQSLRLAAEEVGAKGETRVARHLALDRRVLVEPAPKVELRADGGLAVRFYVRGDLDAAAMAEILEAVRKRAS